MDRSTCLLGVEESHTEGDVADPTIHIISPEGECVPPAEPPDLHGWGREGAHQTPPAQLMGEPMASGAAGGVVHALLHIDTIPAGPDSPPCPVSQVLTV
jgi:hypothetical protein